MHPELLRYENHCALSYCIPTDLYTHIMPFQIDYVTNVFAPLINHYFQKHVTDSKKSSQEQPVDIQIVKRGYYPKGGGIVHVNLHPSATTSSKDHQTLFPPIQLTQCLPIKTITIKAFHAGNCPRWVADKMVAGALRELKSAYRENERFRNRFLNSTTVSKESDGMPVSSIIDRADISITHETSCLGSGSGIIMIAHPNKNNDNDEPLPYPALASSGLGDRIPQQTGSTAAKELIQCISSGGCVDRWLQDQLIPIMALSDGSNGQQNEILCGELTLHTQTAMKVAEWMTGCEFEVERLDKLERGKGHKVQQEGDYGEKGRILGRHIIRCRGISFDYAG